MIIGHVRGQELKLDRTTIAAGSIKYLEAEFHFAGRDWDGYTKTAYFINGTSKFTLVLADDRITADMGLNLTAGEWEVKLSGVKGGSRITTTTEHVYVREFGSTDGTLPDVTATQAEQILAKIGDLSNLTTEDKTNLVAAINEAAKSGGGSGGGKDGKDGTGIASITYKGKDEDGGNVYTVLLTDGTSYDITAPKGAKGDKGDPGDAAEAYYIDLAGNYPSYTCTTAMADIAAAYAAGKELKCRCAMGKYTATLPLFIPMPSANTWIFSGAGALAAMNFPAQTLTIAIDNGAVQASNTRLATLDDISSADLTLGLTGATVGQIAKIAAVGTPDASTAWSPVDMPSGGSETWELINEVTLSEDAMAVVFDKDKSGAPFALRKFEIFGKTKGSDTSNTQGGHVCINTANTPNDFYSIIPPNNSHGALKGDKLRYWNAGAESIAAKGWRWYLTGADNTSVTREVRIGSKLSEVSDKIPALATYLAVFSRTAGDAFAAGSKFELYGVRA